MITLSAKQVSEYVRSFGKSIRALSEGGRPDGLAYEMSNHLEGNRSDFANNLAKLSAGTLTSSDLMAPEGKQSLLVPFDACRALNATNFTAGGATVGSSDQPTIEDILRPASAVLASGAELYFRGQPIEWSNLPTAKGTTLFGGQGNGTLPIPYATDDLAMEWLHEGDTPDESECTFGLLQLTPKRCSGWSTYTTQLLRQTDQAIATFLMGSAFRSLGTAIDRGALIGTGAVGEPLGLFNAPVNTVTFGGAATHAKVLDFQTQVANAEADDNAIAWIAHPNIRAKWRNVLRFAAGSDATLWNCDQDAINSRPARVSTHCSATTGVIAGDFRHIKCALWGAGALEIIIDPYAKKKEGKIEYVVTAWADTGVTKPQAFCKGADSAVA